MLKTATPKFAPEIQASPPLIQKRRIDSLYLASEAPKGANLVVRDSGRGSPLTDAELKASIYARGLINPLIWKEYQGKEYVVAGNRRLKALREIFADAPASMVNTQDVEEFGGDWREIAIDTNLSLPPHLVERYELIVAIATDMKLQPEDVQARFGMTARQFNQVMALGKMSPTIREAWKNAEIDAKTAQAFTLAPDPKEQDRIFAAAKKNAWQGKVRSDDVKRRIVPANQQNSGRLAAFVGIETLKKAKLIKQQNFFEDEHIVTDLKALQKLAEAKISAVCAGLIEDGWSWAIPEVKESWHYGSVDPSAKDAKATPEEKARLAEIERLFQSDEDDDFDDEALTDEQTRLEESIKARGFTPAQRAKTGCFVKIGGNGALVIEYGKIKPEERKAVASTERAAKKKAKPKKPGQATLTNALAERLSGQLEKAIAASLAVTPNVAVAALIAAFASDGHVLDVHVGRSASQHFRPSSGATDEKNFAQVFEGALKATPESRAVMLAGVAAAAVSIQVHSAEAKTPIAGAGLQALATAMSGPTLTKAIAGEFDAKDYFAGVSLQACVDAVRCSMGDEHAGKVAKMKKGEAAKFAAANVPAKGWLPMELRTAHYNGPVEKAAPAKPPKPVKLGAKKPKSLLSKKQQKAVSDQGKRAGKAAAKK